MPLGRPGEVEPGERRGGPARVAADGERHLVEHALAHDVAARILRDVAGAAVRARPARAPAPGARRRPSRASSSPTRSALRARRSRPGRPRARRRRAPPARSVGERTFSMRTTDRVAGRRRLPSTASSRRHVGRGCCQPARRLVDRHVERDAPALEEDHAVGERERPRDAVLAEDDGGTRARATASRKASAPAGSSCEVGSSSSRSAGRSASAAARQTRCSSPPLSSAVARPARCSAPTAASASRARARSRPAPRPRSRGRRRPRRDARHDDLVLGILEHRRDRSRQVGRPGAARVAAGDDDAPGEAAAVEVRHQPGERAQERGLPRAGRAEQGDALARLDRERHVAKGRHAARVGERQPVDGR